MTVPITPPPELVQEWYHEANLSGVPYEETAENWAYEQHIANRAAQWGSDQELDACLLFVTQLREWNTDWLLRELRAARRPKPPSLKEQALETLKYPKDLWSQAEVDTIRRALEQLND